MESFAVCNWPRACSVNAVGFPSLGPLVGITHRADLKFGRKKFILVIHAGYNARGLFGCEMNGIGVLDDVAKLVVLDRHLPQDTGYFGPSQAQIDEWVRLQSLDARSFVEFCKNHPNAR